MYQALSWELWWWGVGHKLPKVLTLLLWVENDLSTDICVKALELVNGPHFADTVIQLQIWRGGIFPGLSGGPSMQSHTSLQERGRGSFERHSEEEEVV